MPRTLPINKFWMFTSRTHPVEQEDRIIVSRDDDDGIGRR